MMCHFPGGGWEEIMSLWFHIVGFSRDIRLGWCLIAGALKLEVGYVEWL